MPDGDGVQRPGRDGRVEADRKIQRLPGGVSIWELSVREDVGKLTEDYEKRLGLAAENPGGTYVAVSARLIPAKDQWCGERRTSGPWRDVLVYDAEDLAQWLDAAPAVAREFAAELDLAGTDVVTLDQHLVAWEQRTSQERFPVETLLAGGARERAAHALRERLRDPSPEPVFVEAATCVDALDFIAGALALDDDAVFSERWKASTLIVESKAELARLMRSPIQSTLVLIPGAVAVDDLSFTLDPSRRLVVPVAIGTSSSGTPILVQPPDSADVVAALVAHGFEPDEAERNVAESGGSLEALRRRYGARGGQPPWSQGVNAPALCAFILADSWVSGGAADEAWLAKVAGVGTDTIRAAWAALEFLPDSPIAKSGVYPRSRVWERHSEAWGWLAPLLSASMLDRFASAAREALTSGVPATGHGFLDPREYAGDTHSTLLRAGVARSLARLTRWSDRVGPDQPTHRRARAVAAEVVGRSLGVSWKQWKALGGSLRPLAEAAPEEFLRALRTSMDNEDGVHRLLDEDGAQTNLLWALETLGWRRNFLPEVTSLLANLAEYDRKLPADLKRMANRPLASLAHLVAPTIAQTEALWPERRAALLQLRSRHPDLVFDVLLGQVPQPIGGLVMSSPRPRFANWSLPSMDQIFERARDEARVATTDSLRDVVEQAGLDIGRWERLIDRVRVARADIQGQVLDALEARYTQMPTNDGRLRVALRHWLHTRAHRSRPEQACVVHDRLRALYDGLAPDDPVALNAWLFSSLRPDLPEPVGTFDEEMAEVERRRIAFVDLAWESADRDGVLSRIAASAGSTSAWRLGIAIASSIHAAEAEPVLLVPQHDRWMREVASVFVARRAELEGDDWLARVLESWRDDGRLDEVVDVVSRCPATRRTWAVIDRLGAQTRARYWSAFRAFPTERSEDAIVQAVESCLSVDNPEGAAMAAWAVGGQVSGSVALAILRALVPFVPSMQERGNSDVNHPVDELFARLVELGGVTDEQGADLELALRPLFGPFRGPGTFIGRVLSKDPDRFVALVCEAFRDPRDRDAADSLRSEMLARVVSDWRGFPGDDLPPSERDEHVIHWARAVLSGMARRGRTSLGLHVLGIVLQRVTVGDSEPWPARPVGRLLEEESDPARPLAHSLAIARFNARGVTSREVAEGGCQERTLSAEYRLAAEAWRADFPKTADMLLDLSLSYERDAQREDEWARGVARFEGLSYDELETSLRKVRGIDVAFALCRALHPGMAMASVATRLGVTLDRLSEPRARLAAAGVADAGTGSIDAPRLLELLRGNVRSAFPPMDQSGPPAEPVRGIRTGIEGIPRLRGALVGQGELRVWKADFGEAFGVCVEPLCPNAVNLKAEDETLFEALALVDALRFGVARERNVARDELRKLLLVDAVIAQVAQ